MIAMRHAGIYVRDIQRLEAFYTLVFRMIPICSAQPDEWELFDELLGISHVRIVTTKMVTEYGKQQGQGDMLELVKVLTACPGLPTLPAEHPISMIGMGHVAFGVDDMEQTVEILVREKGTRQTRIYQRGDQNLCCFCRDPEGNWLELIQRIQSKEDVQMDRLKGKTALVTGGTSGIGGVLV